VRWFPPANQRGVPVNSIRSFAIIAAALLFCQGFAPAGVQAEELFRTQLKPQPKVLRYDEKEDKFYHSHSVLVAPRKELPEGNVVFHGNRLQRYRFIGLPERSGIYGAMDEYNAGQNLNPANYRYRNH